jgi:hypothetical protein
MRIFNLTNYCVRFVWEEIIEGKVVLKGEAVTNKRVQKIM